MNMCGFPYAVCAAFGQKSAGDRIGLKVFVWILLKVPDGLSRWTFQRQDLFIQVVPRGLRETCGCAFCWNFVTACHTGRLPEQWRAALGSLGVDPSKDEGGDWQYNENADGTHLYGGFYHVVESIGSENPSPEDWSAEDNIRFSFSPELELLPASFPLPAIQVEFAANVPWLSPDLPAL